MYRAMLALMIGLSLLLQPAFASMTDIKAMAVATAMFNNIAVIGQYRGPLDTYWQTQVGFNSKGCRNNVTVLGIGQNAWDEAFANIAANVVKGPYSGIVALKAEAWDNVAVAGVQFRIDGEAFGSELLNTNPSANWNVSLSVNMDNLIDGSHSVCPVARDTAGNIGRGNAMIFEVQHGVASISNTIGPVYPDIGK